MAVSQLDCSITVQNQPTSKRGVECPITSLFSGEIFGSHFNFGHFDEQISHESQWLIE